jgi:hypothetical protein
MSFIFIFSMSAALAGLDTNIKAPVITSPAANAVLAENTTSVNVTWTSTYSTFLVRVIDQTDSKIRDPRNSWKGTTNYVYIDAYKKKSIRIPVIKGHSYKFWINASSPKKFNDYGVEAAVYFSVGKGTVATCNAPSETKTCSITNGVGQQSRTCSNGVYSNYSTCAPLSCNSGFKISGNTCIANVVTPPVDLCAGAVLKQSCSITNGSGQQTRTCNAGVFSNYSACAPLNCNSGFKISGNTCIANVVTPPVDLCAGAVLKQSCSITNGSGQQTRTCNAGVFSNYSSCALTNCNSGFSASGNTCIADAPSTAGKCKSITRFAITWTFDGEYTCGQYANGDSWVVAPSTGLKVIGISPKSTVSGGRTINGTTINPKAEMWAKHGFDSSIDGGGFDEDLNAARPGGKDLSASNPLIVTKPSSLISSVSHPTAAFRPTITDISILTVVPSAPAAGSFRPPYAGSDKTHYWNKSHLDYSILKKEPVSGSPTPDSMNGNFTRPWFELATENAGRNFHPLNHQPEYGAYMAEIMGDALLTLHHNYTNAQKEKLYVSIVQWGLDLYGCATTGAMWPDNGGHNAGKKAPVVLAALALNDPKILSYADAKNPTKVVIDGINTTKGFIFAEDRQTWYVTQSDVGRELYQGDGRAREEYISSDIGIPEWGEKHASSPDRDGRNWSTYYRDINFVAHLGPALAIRMTKGGMKAWNWPAFFDYTDRSWVNSASQMNALPASMWRSYRNKYPTGEE